MDFFTDEETWQQIKDLIDSLRYCVTAPVNVNQHLWDLKIDFRQLLHDSSNLNPIFGDRVGRRTLIYSLWNVIDSGIK